MNLRVPQGHTLPCLQAFAPAACSARGSSCSSRVVSVPLLLTFQTWPCQEAFPHALVVGGLFFHCAFVTLYQYIKSTCIARQITILMVQVFELSDAVLFHLHNTSLEGAASVPSVLPTAGRGQRNQAV